MAIRAATFEAWLKRNFTRSELRDMVSHGVDGGFSGLIYTSECVKLFDRFADEIWDLATEQAESMGSRNVAEMIAGFNRSDMLASYDQFRNLMVWFAAEEYARRIVGD